MHAKGRNDNALNGEELLRRPEIRAFLYAISRRHTDLLSEKAVALAFLKDAEVDLWLQDPIPMPIGFYRRLKKPTYVV